AATPTVVILALRSGHMRDHWLRAFEYEREGCGVLGPGSALALRPGRQSGEGYGVAILSG
ncbi:MAG: hypothetical protein ABJD57_13315, partial [Roseibium sp.]|uniref:hypothetical protein n=1 Tax=Roseibium sp. TaxID=1936156 RepID=UPI0032658143